MTSQWFVAISILLCLISHCSPYSHSEKVLLHEVDRIVLRDGHMTNARRVNAIPQLRCMGGSAGCNSAPKPNLVVCTNAGRDRNDARWECEADFDNKYKFGRFQVSCEGYDYPEDPYVLRDSCGLEYELDYDNSHTGYSYQSYNSYSGQQSQSSLSITNILVLLAICFLIYGIYKNTMGAGEERTSSTHPKPPSSAPPPSTTAGTGWPTFLSGLFVGGIANSIFSIISSLFRPNRYGQGYGYGGYGYGQGYGYGSRRGFGYGGGRSHYGGMGSMGGASRKSGFGGTGRR